MVSDGRDRRCTHEEVRRCQFVLLRSINIKLVSGRLPSARLLNPISTQALTNCPSCGASPKGVPGKVSGDAIGHRQPLQFLDQETSRKGAPPTLINRGLRGSAGVVFRRYEDMSLTVHSGSGGLWAIVIVTPTGNGSVFEAGNGRSIKRP